MKGNLGEQQHLLDIFIHVTVAQSTVPFVGDGGIGKPCQPHTSLTSRDLNSSWLDGFSKLHPTFCLELFSAWLSNLFFCPLCPRLSWLSTLSSVLFSDASLSWEYSVPSYLPACHSMKPLRPPVLATATILFLHPHPPPVPPQLSYIFPAHQKLLEVKPLFTFSLYPSQSLSPLME